MGDGNGRVRRRSRGSNADVSDEKRERELSGPRRRKSSAGFGLDDSKKARKPAATSVVVDTLLRLAVACLFLLAAALLAVSYARTPQTIVFMSDGARQAGLLQTVSASTYVDERRVRVPCGNERHCSSGTPPTSSPNQRLS
jgi:hypothetical protein